MKAGLNFAMAKRPPTEKAPKEGTEAARPKRRGGAPKGNRFAAGHGAPIFNTNALKHGAYRSIFRNERDYQLFVESIEEMRSDPAGALLVDAAMIRAMARRTVESADTEHRLTLIERTETTAGEFPGATDKRVSVAGPVADVLYRAAAITERAFELDPDRRSLDRLRIKAETEMLKTKASESAPQSGDVTVIVQSYADRDPEGSQYPEPCEAPKKGRGEK